MCDHDECSCEGSVEHVQEVGGTVYPKGIQDFPDNLLELLRDVKPEILVETTGVWDSLKEKEGLVSDVRRWLVGDHPTLQSVGVDDAGRFLSEESAQNLRFLFSKAGKTPEEAAQRAWQAILADPDMVTLDPGLLKQMAPGMNPQQQRMAVAARIARSMGNTPFIPGARARNTKLGLHQMAQHYAERFNANALTNVHLRQMNGLVNDLMGDYRKQLDGFLGKMGKQMAGARTEDARLAILAKVNEKGGLLQSQLEGLRAATKDFATDMEGLLDQQSLDAWTSGIDRTLNRMWDVHDLPGNQFGDLKRNLSEGRRAATRARMGREFFRVYGDEIRFALANNPVLAGRVAEEARKGITKIITKTSFLRGENHKFAAREIKKEFGEQLRGLRHSVQTRAKRIARTETTRIQAEAELSSLGKMGVQYVEVYYTGGAYPCHPADAIISGKVAEDILPGDVVDGPDGQVLVRAVSRKPFSGNLVILEEEGGQTIRLTPDHPVYVFGDGYLPAKELEPGDRVDVVKEGVSVVRGGVLENLVPESGGTEVLLEELFVSGQEKPHRGQLRDMCQTSAQKTERGDELSGLLLQSGMSQKDGHQILPNVREEVPAAEKSGGDGSGDVLFGGVLPDGVEVEENGGLRYMRERVRGTEIVVSALLRTSLLPEDEAPDRSSTPDAGDSRIDGNRVREGGSCREIRGGFSDSRPGSDPGSRRCLSPVQGGGGEGLATRRVAEASGVPSCEVPAQAGNEEQRLARSSRIVRKRAEAYTGYVYNLTVEGEEYRASGFLVHNCQICPDVASGGPYAIHPINRVPMGGIPFHPNCQCQYAPFTEDEKTLATRSILWNEGENRAADSIVVVRRGGEDYVLMIERQDGQMALPGGFVDGNQAGLDAARKTARRELQEETGLNLKGMRGTQVGYFADKARDPRAGGGRWVSSRGFLFDLGEMGRLPDVKGLDDAVAAKWVKVSDVMRKPMFADHSQILKSAMDVRQQRGIAGRIAAAIPPRLKAVELPKLTVTELTEVLGVDRRKIDRLLSSAKAAARTVLGDAAKVTNDHVLQVAEKFVRGMGRRVGSLAARARDIRHAVMGWVAKSPLVQDVAYWWKGNTISAKIVRNTATYLYKADRFYKKKVIREFLGDKVFGRGLPVPLRKTAWALGIATSHFVSFPSLGLVSYVPGFSEMFGLAGLATAQIPFNLYRAVSMATSLLGDKEPKIKVKKRPGNSILANLSKLFLKGEHLKEGEVPPGMKLVTLFRQSMEVGRTKRAAALAAQRKTKIAAGLIDGFGGY